MEELKKTSQTKMSFLDYRSELWDESGQSRLSSMDEFPKAFYDFDGFQVDESALKKNISSLQYINLMIRDPEMPLLGFRPIMDKNDLVGFTSAINTSIGNSPMQKKTSIS